MLVRNPVGGRKIVPDKRYYPDAKGAVFRPRGSRRLLVTHDFGPSDVVEEPTVHWPGGELNILGKRIRAQKYNNFHLGIDISRGGCGADVLAVAKGRVLVSEKNEARTEVIVIGHGLINGHRYRTRYAHMRERFVKVDDEVEAGAVIGEIGDTGIHSTDCHLHFAMEKDRRPIDPWRRLLQNTSIDPDAPAGTAPEPVQPAPEEEPDVPIPASNDEYLAGRTAVVGNTAQGAHVREGSEIEATRIRTIPAGTQETWKPTCWVKGEKVGDSEFADRWLTRWFDGKWEFTHFDNVRSVTPLG